jgi:hypothetical protein
LIRLGPVLYSLAFLHVSVPAGTVAGRVLSVEGGVPAKAELTLFRMRGGLSGLEPVDSIRADSLGRYAFPKVETGRWHVEARAPNCRSSFVTVYLPDSGESLAVDLVLRPGSGVLGPGAVTGRVRDASDAKGLRAVVILFRMHYSEKEPSPKAIPADTVRADSLGRYLLDSLDFRTEYRITVSMPGYVTANESRITVALRQTLNRNFDLVRIRRKALRPPSEKK